MTRCAKFHHLFDEVGNFCGMSPTAISQYKAYREQVNKLVKLGIDEDFVFENFPEGPGRVLSNIKDDETRTKAINYVASCLTRKERVTEGDLRSTLKSWQESTGKSCTVGKKGGNLGRVSKTFTNVKPATSAPAQSLAAQLKNEPHGPETNQPPANSFKTASQVKDGIAGEMYPDHIVDANKTIPVWTPALCRTGPCPDGKSHASHDKIRGFCCDLTGQPVNQLSACQYLERQKKAIDGGFVIPGKPITDERPPLRIVKTPLTDEERKTLADAFVERTGRTANEIRQIDELVTARYENIKSRFELIDKAVSWFLAQAEGE